MLNDNLKRIRQKKGFTQEELAARVNVVRQTVSKWEKGLSVPDADLLQSLADVLEVSVSELLGAAAIEPENRDEVAQQLARINEQLAIKTRRARRVWKTIAIVLVASVVFWGGLIVLSVANFSAQLQHVTETQAIEDEE